MALNMKSIKAVLGENYDQFHKFEKAQRKSYNNMRQAMILS